MNTAIRCDSRLDPVLWIYIGSSYTHQAMLEMSCFEECSKSPFYLCLSVNFLVTSPHNNCHAAILQSVIIKLHWSLKWTEFTLLPGELHGCWASPGFHFHLSTWWISLSCFLSVKKKRKLLISIDNLIIKIIIIIMFFLFIFFPFAPFPHRLSLRSPFFYTLVIFFQVAEFNTII